MSTCEQDFFESTRTLLKPSSLAAGGAVGLAIFRMDFCEKQCQLSMGII